MHTMRLRGVVAAGVILSIVGVSAQGAMLSPGATLYPVPSESDPLGGVIEAGPLASPFNTTTFSGTLTTHVISGDTSNTLGGLTFVYELTSDSTSQNDIRRLTLNGFSAFATDASYQVSTARLSPSYVDRDANGDVVGFGFLGAPIGFGALAPGEGSAVLVVQTDAPDWRPSFASVIDGTVASTATYAPIPEPLTLGFMLLGMALVRRR
ncbi:MAG: hypothetical protein JXA69_17020 [Phycisphaerae bacterium]|nr:hypothetical protein [Phycisphaerae bacterium]